MKQKALAIVLALCMVISMLPVTAFAAQPQSSGTMVPNTVGKLEPAAIEPNAKSYSVTLTGSSHGTVELLVDSPAKAGSEVYFLADPDDGYLAEVYYEGLDDDALVYVGADVIGFIMPANKVTLEVKFVEAEGEEHRISLYGADGGGQCQVSRTSAKEYESVLLAVLPEHDYDFEPTELVWAFGADVYYLFEQDGIYYYEIFMGDEDVKILLCYSVRGAHKITKDFWGGKLELESDYAVTNKEVVFSVTPPDDEVLDEVQVITEKGGIPLELTYLGEEQGSYTYSFIMPPCGVSVKLKTHALTWNITVNHNSGGVAYAERTSSPKNLGIRVTCVPDEGYRVASVTGNVTITDKGNDLYSFIMPEHDVTIDVTFRKIYNPITVTVDTGLGGTASADLAEAKAGEIVTLTCVPEEGYRVAQITGADVIDNGDGTYTFPMPDGPADIHVLFLRQNNPFLDVNETRFFHDPVLWAVENGITNGIDDTHFGPFLNTNRAAVVTMLWRYAGSPEPTTTENPFEDVPADSWYTKPVLWAVENGITNGLTATTFGPNEVCNRAQVVTFLYRALKASVPEDVENPFVDVSAGKWYEAPVLWAFANGVTTGADATHFNPNGDCLRAQFVTFLYRASLIPEAYDLHWVINGFQDTPSDYGTVTLSCTKATAGETVTATVVPAEGYVLDWVKCENGTPVTQVSETEYTFVMPDHEEIFHVNFSKAPEEPEPTDPTEPTDPEEPAVTYSLTLKSQGSGRVAYGDKMRGEAGESLFFYAVPDEGWYLAQFTIFDPTNDIGQILIYAHENNMYEIVMPARDAILTAIFLPIEG